ncbi:EAL domain-containing protein [Phenylobacterium aquaticum]|uniref:EAL domain-containing protein n=1 Tax=Phenylobacterium aquaticum TaxID=1763816 RepID=UPI001F5DAB7C|nr:EAL domain-containing protein [Phenylobacterium aquaticum]MCI3133158.1 EAL domain-containing protein [Phenylobacterium aquaticum]
MFQVYTCLTRAHDFRLVVLAALVCLLTASTAMGLLRRLSKVEGASRLGWLITAAAVTGEGVWATHFVAMLAFRPGLHTGYDLAETLMSLVVAIGLFGIGFQISHTRRMPARSWIGGAFVGGAVGAMHYLGMAAFRIEGELLWDPGLVALSLGLGTTFSALAFAIQQDEPRLRGRIAAILSLTLGICGLHFTGMGAVTILPDASVHLPPTVIPTDFLAVWVAGGAAALLLLSAVALSVEHQQRRGEQRRMRELADAAVEGLAICDDAIITTANASLARMIGLPATDLVGQPFASLFLDAAVSDRADLEHGHRLERHLQGAEGERVPVELIAQKMSFDGQARLGVAVRDLRDRVAAETQIRFLAHHDGLTQLPNRARFHEQLNLELQRHRRRDDGFAVLCLDLDRFKQVNDVFGHAAGDLVLSEVATRISRTLGDEDFLARLGGDEFAIIRLAPCRPADLAALCGAIIDAIAPEIALDAQTTLVGVSIGIALYPSDGDTAATLVRNADAALYRAKEDGRGVYRFFEAALGAQMRERLALEFDLRHALVRNELKVVYQPQSSLISQEVFGFEALVRWNHRTRGAVPPADFIPVAEETGLIMPIGDWVLREACAEAASWPNPLQMAVNLSAVQLRSPTLPRRVHEILLETGLAAERLELEVTETALIEDFNQALHTLRQLKALGVKIAMDDFGTGYSSLSNLRAFPFDKIKIDQSFIRHVHDNAQAATIVRAILGLGRGLNLKVLAEGVETAEELAFLRQELCGEAQGYLFGRPGDIDDFASLVGRNLAPDRHDRPFQAQGA